MKKKIVYWSPCLNKVGTVISTKNSAIAMAKYKKKHYEIFIINTCGEWNIHKDEFLKSGVKIINFNFDFFNLLPKEGFLSSRFSYIVIFLTSLFPLLRFLKKNNPDYLIMHLITSLPLALLTFFNFKTKFVLRISGMPKLNFLRKFLWKLCAKKLFSITCPTIELKKKIINSKIFDVKKVFYLQDAIINLDNFRRFKDDLAKQFKGKKIILAAGRLTKQKNFLFLIEEISNFLNENNYILIILGEGEEKRNLKNFISKKQLTDKVFLPGRVENIYDYMRSADVFILSSLWEEIGFVIVEAAFNNLFIISSDCPNGPKEFLENGKNGILFKNNSKNELFNNFNNFLNLKSLYRMQVNAKKKARQYSKFNHHLKLHKILYEN